MRNSFGLGLLAPSLLLATPALARPPWLQQPHTWGKAGISYLQYRTDAAECSLRGIAPPAMLKDVRTTRSGQRVIVSPSAGNYWTYSNTSDLLTDLYAYQADEAMTSYRTLQVMRGGIEDCLIGRGYRMIMLTDAQDRELGGFRRGSQSRQMFLYRLSVDPQVLATQTVAKKAAR